MAKDIDWYPCLQLFKLIISLSLTGNFMSPHLRILTSFWGAYWSSQSFCQLDWERSWLTIWSIDHFCSSGWSPFSWFWFLLEVSSRMNLSTGDSRWSEREDSLSLKLLPRRLKFWIISSPRVFESRRYIPRIHRLTRDSRLDWSRNELPEFRSLDWMILVSSSRNSSSKSCRSCDSLSSNWGLRLTICMNSLSPARLDSWGEILNCLAKPRNALHVWMTLNWGRFCLLISLILSIFTSDSIGSVILIPGSAGTFARSLFSSALSSFFRSVFSSGWSFLTFLVGLRTEESIPGISSSRISLAVRILSIIPVFSIGWIPWFLDVLPSFEDQRLWRYLF